MKSLFLLLVLSLLSLSSGQFEMPCLLTNYLEEDHAAYVAEAEELGWYTDGKPDADAIVADVGQEVFDACHEMAEEVDETNVRDATCEFYECDCAGYGTPGGDACWQEEGVVQMAKEVVLFDCLGLSGSGGEPPCGPNSEGQ